MDDLVAAMGGTGISKSEVSRICAGLDEVVGAFRTRRLDHEAFPYVFLDATYLHVRSDASQVVSKAVVIATGVTADRPPGDPRPGRRRQRRRGVLARLPDRLKKRGWPGCSWSSPTSTPARRPPLDRAFQGVAHQRCRVHFIRNLLAHYGFRRSGAIHRWWAILGLNQWDLFRVSVRAHPPLSSS